MYKRVLIKLSGEALAGDKKQDWITKLSTKSAPASRKSMILEQRLRSLLAAATSGEAAAAETWTAPEQTTSECLQPL